MRCRPARSYMRNHGSYAALLQVPVGKAPGWRTSATSIVKYSWLNVLLIFVPVSSSLHQQKRALNVLSSLQVSWAMHFSGQSRELGASEMV